MRALLVLVADLLAGVAARRFSEVTKSRSCQSCPEMVSMEKHVGMEWEIFPPHPMPAVEVAMVCHPNPAIEWGPDASKQVDAALADEDCGVEAAEGLSSQDRQNCQEQYSEQSQRASWLGLPVAFLQQMAVCGRCAVCNAFAKVQKLWQHLKSAMKKVASKLRSIKRKLFGYAYASASVRQKMKERIDGYFPQNGHGSSSSALQLSQDTQLGPGQLEDADETQQMQHERLVEEHLTVHLKSKSAEEVEQHLVLLQSKLEEMERSEEELLRSTRRDFMANVAANQHKIEEQLPIALNNEDCQEVMRASMESKVLELSLYISFPDIVNAVLLAVVGNFIGALHALVPEISIVAIPKGGKAEDLHVERCTEAIRDARQPLLDACTHEQPLVACTARTFQRLMQGALSQQWWPLMHNAEGTPGSIDLGYKYDELMNALRCSSKNSCLEKGLADLESEDVKRILENRTSGEMQRFAELQCSFAGNRVDTEDVEKGKLPVFSDKIWVAALKAHGATMQLRPSETAPCPSVLPFVVAFCASSLRCLEESDDAGKGYFALPEFENARSRVEVKLAPLQNITPTSVDQMSLEEYDTSFEKLPERQRLERFWTDMVNSQYSGLEPKDDAFQWKLLWKTANFTSKVGLLKSWPQIAESLSGDGDPGDKEVDWFATRHYWEMVAFTAFVRQGVRQALPQASSAAEQERTLAQVTRNLRSIWDTKLCSPGALGGLKEEHLKRLGVTDEVSLIFALADKEALGQAMWRKWMVLHIKPSDLDSVHRPNLDKFSSLLEDHTCDCMCYDQCGKLEASAYVTCNPISPGAPEEEIQTEALKLFAREVVVDKVHKSGAVYKDAELSVQRLPGLGGCRSQLVLRSLYGAYKNIAGHISKCEVPHFFNQSKIAGDDLKIILWSDEGAAEPLNFQAYEKVKLVNPFYYLDSDSDIDSDFDAGSDSSNSLYISPNPPDEH
ncbi:unnamed protein product [Symbiodinium microadriaticum]|nr:unnamed protein product [Symbiodinium microadriaticum]